MKKIIKLTIFLSIVCAICSGVLYYTNEITAPKIAEIQKENTDKMLNKMVDADSFKDQKVDSRILKNVYTAVQGGKETVKILEVHTVGFQSELKILVALDGDKYAGFEVIDQAETPGYGTQIETDKNYIKQFKEKSINDELDTITGSTVTTKAIREAITEAISIYQEQK